MAGPLEEFVHQFEPGSAADPTLLALHGTGGNEHDLVSLAQLLRPGAAVLSPRGRVLERGMPRFFRRLAEGVFDLPDLALRTEELAQFVTASAEHYAFDPARVVAVGFSNGANIAASLLLAHPRLLQGAVLFRAMVPFTPNRLPELAHVPVFIGAGRYDEMVPVEHPERLAAMLRDAGAEVTLHWDDGGHGLERGTVMAARAWLDAAVPATT